MKLPKIFRRKPKVIAKVGSIEITEAEAAKAYGEMRHARTTDMVRNAGEVTRKALQQKKH